MRATLSVLFKQEGFTVSEAERVEEAVEKVKRQVYDAAIVDLRLGGQEEGGLDLLKVVKKINPGTEAIVITGYGSIETAVTGMKLGAADYLKPFHLDELVRTIRAATPKKTPQSKLRHLRNEVQEARRPADLVASSPKTLRILDMASQVARTDATVLIQGERGTGKEVVARAIHHSSPRAERDGRPGDGPLHPLQCAPAPVPHGRRLEPGA